jgi:hypothetical protein
MPAPAELLKLVEQFRENRDVYLSDAFTETSLRRQFIDPMFELLGWDVLNRQGHAEAYKEVVHEDSLKIGGSTKSPDYLFRVGPERKFFVETKKPSVNIKQDVAPAFQLRRYGWSAKLPLSILTDFEEFAVYDCRVRPVKTDSPSTGRILYVTFDQYADRWDQIAAVFSRDAVLKGSFDRFAESTRKKRGTAEVDAAFLDDIDGWRLLLARNLALRNPQLSPRDLNFAVQKIIDRIIFLRICEDRGMETYGRLQVLPNGPHIYPRLCELFHEADHRYNSGLFHFVQEKHRHETPDEWTLELAIDDAVLKEIIRKLYYPDSPYEFSVIGADILGHVYEQFLGKVIRLTAGHQAKVEEKPEVRKAGGVYYTPTYIVNYIVQNTIGKLLEGKTPHEVAARTPTWKPAKGGRPLSVLDPACGSGSFLIGAYQYLLDWYRDWFVADDPVRHKDRVHQTHKGQWRLSTAERKRILLDHIYGVDIDPQAVEVTKLSLLLKVLEGKTKETLQRQLFAKERALPDLADNIKCGNSLIGPDFYHGKQLDLFDDEERLRINVFDWTAEFSDIMKMGGFDAVIGNPPYIRMEAFKELKEYLRDHYESHAERSDLYVYFIEREHDLLRDGGAFGMIVSNKFLRAKYGEGIRARLSKASNIHTIVDLAGLPVFHGATVRTIILLTTKGQENVPAAYCPPLPVEDFRSVEARTKSLSEAALPHFYNVDAKNLAQDGWQLLRPECSCLMQRLRGCGATLGETVQGRICRGVVSGLTEAFVVSAERRSEIIAANREAEQIIFPFLEGRKIRRYFIENAREFLIYTHHGIDMRPYPAVKEHLRPFRQRLEARATKQKWYELQQPQFAYFDYLKSPKIVFPDIATTCRFTLDGEGHFGANTVYFLPTDDLALLGLLNANLAFFFFQQACAALEGPGEAYLRFFGQYLEGFPVALASMSKPSRGSLTEQVGYQLATRKSIAAAKTAHERAVFERQVEANDQEINRLVYELYGLTDEEIRIVEESTAAVAK